MQSQLGWAARCLSVMELSFAVSSLGFHPMEFRCQNLCTLPATGVQCVSISGSLISLIDPLKTQWWLFWIEFLNQSNVLKTLSPKMLQVWALLPKSSIVAPDHVRKCWGSLKCCNTLCVYTYGNFVLLSNSTDKFGSEAKGSMCYMLFASFRCMLNVPRTQRLPFIWAARSCFLRCSQPFTLATAVLCILTGQHGQRLHGSSLEPSHDWERKWA